ncbi:MAG: Lrp/AsnC family transcriptional regulator, partial [Candidatus Nitrosocosmicus sp.]
TKFNGQVDDLDIKIIHLMMRGNNNKQIATQIKVPLSTVQRRTKRLIAEQAVLTKTELNYEMFGFKKGLLHIYVENGDINKMVKDISKLRGISSIEVHIGNSDIIGNVIYKNSMELLDLITDVKKMDGVERIVWSEQIYSIPANSIEVNDML